MIFGFLFGSVFGVETLLNPVHQSLFGVREKLFEVMDASATMPLLIGAVAIGAVLILMTMIINIYLNIKRKEMAEALFSQNGVAGFIFYGYIILFLIGMFMPDMLPFNPGSKPLMIPVHRRAGRPVLHEGTVKRLNEGRGTDAASGLGQLCAGRSV